MRLSNRWLSRRVMWGGALAVAALGWLASAGSAQKRQAEEPQRRKAIRAFMNGKLDAARTILDGLVKDRMDLVQGGADSLLVMSKRAEWNVVKGAEYRKLSEEFRNSVELLGKAAKAKNADSAALVYLQVTMQCIACHKKKFMLEAVDRRDRGADFEMYVRNRSELDSLLR